MLDQSQVCSVQDILLDVRTVVESSCGETRGMSRTNAGSAGLSRVPRVGPYSRNLFGIDDEPCMRVPEVALQLCFNGGQFTERWRDFPQDPRCRDIRHSEPQ